MSNTEAKGKKAVSEISPILRRAFIAAAARLGKGDSEAGLRDLMEKQLKENPLATLNAIARFLPQERKVTGKIEHDHNHKHIAVQEVTSRIAGLLELGTDSDSKTSLPH